MEVGLGEVNLQVAMSKNLSISKTPVFSDFCPKKGVVFRGCKSTHFFNMSKNLEKDLALQR